LPLLAEYGLRACDRGFFSSAKGLIGSNVTADYLK